ncbi:MAG: 5'-nucleotidase C-terminal domain-containing protein [Campylobacterota bacterium]|nr:5'-nucleotidase C-terminal domain-containing protein [Campylobacterota bacterium]
MYLVKLNPKYKYIIYFTILFTINLFFLGCTTSSTSEKKTNIITIIGTADLQGLMEPYKQEYDVNGRKEEILGGGISKISSVLKQAKNENPFGTFIVSTGDDLMGRYFHTFKGEAIYSLMSQSGYELYAPGNHEFDKGTEVFANALKYAEFDTICSDLAIKDTLLEDKCIPYKIIHAKGAKIGFFSLMTEDFPLITSPGKVKLKASNLLVAQDMVNTLQNEHCSIIIGLTHIGLEQDKLLAKEVKGIDIIFGGHSHRYTEKLIRINDTLIMNGGEQGSYIVKLDLPLDKKHHIKKEEANYTLTPVIAPIVPDKEVEKRLKEYKAQLPATIILGKTTVEWDLTTDKLRQEESNVVDLINDLLRDKFNVDIVMNNAGAFRGKKVYPAGNITDTMLHEIDGFSNNVYILNIEGKYLRQVLEHSATLYGEGGLMQVSGIHYTMDLSKNPQVIKQNDNGTWVIEKTGERISRISIEATDGTLTPLKDETIYQVLSNAYLVNHAGDGYFWFEQYGRDQKNTYTTFYTIMTEYVEKHTIMDPKPLDGRLEILRSFK